mmetsp:Transcript_18179/g.40384  ORF Transcript_18179/g.40384 Transcript_18179/m.40384 type:complete len:137 (+) Transcript_18179:694-1104(+)
MKGFAVADISPSMIKKGDPCPRASSWNAGTTRGMGDLALSRGPDPGDSVDMVLSKPSGDPSSFFLADGMRSLITGAPMFRPGITVDGVRRETEECNGDVVRGDVLVSGWSRNPGGAKIPGGGRNNEFSDIGVCEGD